MGTLLYKRALLALLCCIGFAGAASAQIVTRTTLKASPNPGSTSSNVTFTATVVPQQTTSLVPTGNVQFTGMSGNVYTIPVTNGMATLILQFPIGSYTFTATYLGDSNFSPSPPSNPVVENILNATSLTLGVSPNPGNYGQRVTLTATVAPGSATGTVTFYDRQNIIGVGPIVNGLATFSTTQLPSGERLLTAHYSGDSDDTPSNTSNSVNATIVAQTGFGFSAPHSIPAGAGPVSVMSGDFNNDGFTDLAVANSGSSSISVFLGNGDGTFAAAVSYTVGAQPEDVVTGDFNQDGVTDLAVASQHGVDILLGHGDGTFAPSTAISLPTPAFQLVVLDLNKDGISDLVASNSGASSLSVLLGNGNGTFQAPTTAAVPATPGALAAGDFNLDGKTDVAVVSPQGVTVLLGAGDGTFSSTFTYAAGSGPNAILVKDLNGDNNQDLIVTNGNDGTVSVLLGAGGGVFQTQMTYPAGVAPNSIGSSDFNGDGKTDLVISNNTTGPNVTVLLGNGNGSFQAPIQYEAEPNPASAIVVQLNGNAQPDVVVVSQINNSVDILLNGFASLSMLAGNGQSTPVNSLYPQQLQVTAYAFGQPAPAVSVTFIGSNGLFSGYGASATVVTASNGVATAPAYLASAQTGPNTVTASAGGNTVTFSLTKTAQSCSFSVSPASVALDANGGAASFNVVASAPNCLWGAGSASPAIIIGNPSGTGNGTVNVLVSANSTGVDQILALLVAGQTISVSVAGTVEVFSDVTPADFYFDYVNNLAAKGITSGCSTNPPDYCPNQPVTRAEMAVFIVRSIYGGDNFTLNQQTPYFQDVPEGSFGYQWIQKLYELGITSGCDSVPDYCPGASVTRAQMAIFIIKARYGATAQLDIPSTPYFTDVLPGAFAYASIQRMAFDGITSGCTSTTYCPNQNVTRGEMALFIMKALFNEFPSTTPILVSSSPSTLAPGTPVNVTVTGANTHFAQGTTVVNPITGVTVGAVIVVSPTELQVTLTDNGTASGQPESIWVSTGLEEEVLPNQLLVQ